MNIIVCLDDKNGMMFNKRRQSQDKLLRADISDSIGNSNLFMNHYSYKLYKDIDNGKVQVCDDFLNKCGSNDFCLIEDKSLFNYANNIDTLIVYKWNRVYPADLYFDIDLQNSNWKLIESTEFQGSSHDKITKEIYRRIH
ncbi:ribonuclease Z [Clostridium sp. NSJ-6]|uniref:Ribonuclease Z n=1 Tax=Clostridium hominis TaxID=2763036 RepID=A0ABR7D8I2_9CLOT|nr:hypothetical protein [Clostridium hominis]MBC5627685.1 ribonuclease Z [Clostridium hominis]MDU2673058.1 ribonuclease Z [Clostridium sp.]